MMTETVDSMQAELEALAREDTAVDPAPGEYAGEGAASAGGGIDPQEVALVATLAKMSGDLMAARRGGHWRLDEQEAATWAEAAVPVLNKWAPDFKSSPELALCLCTGMIVLPRLQQDKALAAALQQARDERVQQDKGAVDAGASGYQPAE